MKYEVKLNWHNSTGGLHKWNLHEESIDVRFNFE